MQSGASRSIWVSESVPDYTPLERDGTCDVCIVGAGIAGLTTAYLLAREGHDVIVLEDGGIGGGETARTTAHLSNALDDRYSILRKLHGAEGARLAAMSHSAAIDRIEAIVRAEGIECGFTRLDGYLFCSADGDAQVLENELAAAREAGLEAVGITDASPLPGFDVGRALRFPRQGQFHPLQYLSGIARAFTASGGRIHTSTHVTGVVDGKPARVVTQRGPEVTAGTIVVATNSPISDRFAIHTKQAAYRTYVIGLAIDSGAVPFALFWDTEDPYHYVRTHATGSESTLIVGGEDHKTGQAHDAAERFARLEAWTRQRFPTAGAARYRWSGQVIEPVDGLAFIGRDPTAEHVYIATGDSGHGMTHGTIAGVLITDLLAGRSNPWAKLYAPDRKPVRAAATYLRENLNVARHMADHLLPGDVSRLGEIRPGTGAIVRAGARHLAVYRDDAGVAHAYSAVCTHVGCVVKWNDLEKTWDCPCHGSRFDVNGEVVNGPAHSPLTRVTLEGDSDSVRPANDRAASRPPPPPPVERDRPRS